MEIVVAGKEQKKNLHGHMVSIVKLFYVNDCCTDSLKLSIDNSKYDRYLIFKQILSNIQICPQKFKKITKNSYLKMVIKF